jgi:hypothetical protein
MIFYNYNLLQSILSIMTTLARTPPPKKKDHCLRWLLFGGCSNWSLTQVGLFHEILKAYCQGGGVVHAEVVEGERVEAEAAGGTHRLVGQMQSIVFRGRHKSETI